MSGIENVKEHDFVIGPTDTDSISFCKKTMEPFSEEEIDILIKEINDISPEFMLWEDDGYFPNVLVLKAKNYVLYDGKKKKIKGSALRDTKREPALAEFIGKVADSLLFEKNDVQEIYLSYVKEAYNVKDIKRWAAKKTITASVLDPKRTNEQKVLDALAGTEYSEGDNRWFFFREDETLCLVDKFDGNYDRVRFVEKVYKTLLIFSNVIDITQFTKYHLVKNQKLLKDL
jgi:hypothetical protein